MDTWASQVRQGTPEPQHPPPGAARVGPGRPAGGPACWASPRAPRPADRQMSRAAQNAAARAAHGPACASKARTRRPLAPPHRCPVAASPNWVNGQAFPVFSLAQSLAAAGLRTGGAVDTRVRTRHVQGLGCSTRRLRGSAACAGASSAAPSSLPCCCKAAAAAAAAHWSAAALVTASCARQRLV